MHRKRWGFRVDINHRLTASYHSSWRPIARRKIEGTLRQSIRMTVDAAKRPSPLVSDIVPICLCKTCSFCRFRHEWGIWTSILRLCFEAGGPLVRSLTRLSEVNYKVQQITKRTQYCKKSRSRGPNVRKRETFLTLLRLLWGRSGSTHTSSQVMTDHLLRTKAA
jgi:hypothetical protein